MNQEIEEPILIGNLEDIDKNSVENFEHEELDYAIYHLDSGFFATQGLCTCEENALLSEGTIENEEIECSNCRETFSIVSGDSISNPEAESIKVYDIVIEKNKLFLNL